MNRIKFNKPREDKAWPVWIIAFSGGLVVLLAVTLLLGSVGGCHGSGDQVPGPAREFEAARGAHIAQAFAAILFSADLVFAVISSST